MSATLYNFPVKLSRKRLWRLFMGLTLVSMVAAIVALNLLMNMEQTHMFGQTDGSSQKLHVKLFKRGIIQFLPSGPGRERYMVEFNRFFYNSWRYTCLQHGRQVPQTVKTDIIVFMSRLGASHLPDECKEILFDGVDSTNVTYLRQLKNYHMPDKKQSRLSKCFWIDYKKLDTHDVWHYMSADNIIYFNETKFWPFLYSYDYLLKAESDTFLTPAFTHWIPGGIRVGLGAYAKRKLT
eukprot:713290_1